MEAGGNRYDITTACGFSVSAADSIEVEAGGNRILEYEDLLLEHNPHVKDAQELTSSMQEGLVKISGSSYPIMVPGENRLSQHDAVAKGLIADLEQEVSAESPNANVFMNQEGLDNGSKNFTIEDVTFDGPQESEVLVTSVLEEAYDADQVRHPQFDIDAHGMPMTEAFFDEHFMFPALDAEKTIRSWQTPEEDVSMDGSLIGDEKDKHRILNTKVTLTETDGDSITDHAVISKAIEQVVGTQSEPKLVDEAVGTHSEPKVVDETVGTRSEPKVVVATQSEPTVETISMDTGQIVIESNDVEDKVPETVLVQDRVTLGYDPCTESDVKDVQESIACALEIKKLLPDNLCKLHAQGVQFRCVSDGDGDVSAEDLEPLQAPQNCGIKGSEYKLDTVTSQGYLREEVRNEADSKSTTDQDEAVSVNQSRKDLHGNCPAFDVGNKPLGEEIKNEANMKSTSGQDVVVHMHQSEHYLHGSSPACVRHTRLDKDINNESSPKSKTDWDVAALQPDLHGICPALDVGNTPLVEGVKCETNIKSTTDQDMPTSVHQSEQELHGSCLALDVGNTFLGEVENETNLRSTTNQDAAVFMQQSGQDLQVRCSMLDAGNTILDKEVKIGTNMKNITDQDVAIYTYQLDQDLHGSCPALDVGKTILDKEVENEANTKSNTDQDAAVIMNAKSTTAQDAAVCVHHPKQDLHESCPAWDVGNTLSDEEIENKANTKSIIDQDAPVFVHRSEQDLHGSCPMLNIRNVPSIGESTQSIRAVTLLAVKVKEHESYMEKAEHNQDSQEGNASQDGEPVVAPNEPSDTTTAVVTTAVVNASDKSVGNEKGLLLYEEEDNDPLDAPPTYISSSNLGGNTEYVHEWQEGSEKALSQSLIHEETLTFNQDALQNRTAGSKSGAENRQGVSIMEVDPEQVERESSKHLRMVGKGALEVEGTILHGRRSMGDKIFMDVDDIIECKVVVDEGDCMVLECRCDGDEIMEHRDEIIEEKVAAPEQEKGTSKYQEENGSRSRVDACSLKEGADKERENQDQSPEMAMHLGSSLEPETGSLSHCIDISQEKNTREAISCNEKPIPCEEVTKESKKKQSHPLKKQSEKQIDGHRLPMARTVGKLASGSSEAKQSGRKRFDEGIGHEWEHEKELFNKKMNKSLKEGGAFGIGDLVWAKVRSHPWWPAQIFYPTDASVAARKVKKSGRVLVAFFGDCTFAWLQQSQMIGFRSNFSKKVKQTIMRSFCMAVEEALEEVCRRSELGLSCIHFKGPLHSTSTFPDANAGIREGVRVESHRDMSTSAQLFRPDRTLEFMKSVACSPLGSWCSTLQVAELRGHAYGLRTYIVASGGCDAALLLKGAVPPHGSKLKRSFSSSKADDDGAPEGGKRAKKQGDQVARKSKEDRYGKKLKWGYFSKAKPLGQEAGHARSSDDGGETLLALAGNHVKVLKKSSIIEVGTPDSKDTLGGTQGPKHLTASKSTKIVEEEGIKKGCLLNDKYSTKSELMRKPSKVVSLGESIKKVAGKLTGTPVKHFDAFSAKNVKRGLKVRFKGSEDVNLLQHQPSLKDKAGGETKKQVKKDVQVHDTKVIAAKSPPQWQNVPHKSQRSCVQELALAARKRKSEIVHEVVAKLPKITGSHGQHARKGVAKHTDKPGELRSLEKSLLRYSRRPDMKGFDQHYDEKLSSHLPLGLFMRFPEDFPLPSESQLKAMFIPFGPLLMSATRLYNDSSSAQVVFKHGRDAESAMKHAKKNAMFGQVAVTYRLRHLPHSSRTEAKVHSASERKSVSSLQSVSSQEMAEEHEGMLSEAMSTPTGNAMEPTGDIQFQMMTLLRQVSVIVNTSPAPSDGT